MDRVSSADGTSIAYRRLGQGPPVVLVNGALSDHTGGLPLAAELERVATVFVYDRRARGASGDRSVGPDGAPLIGQAVDRELEDLAAVLAAAGGSATLVGTSAGGVLALAAAREGLAATAVVVFEPPLTTPQFPLPAPPDLPERLAALVGRERRGEAVTLFLTEAVGMPEAAVTAMRAQPDWARREALAGSTVYDTELSRRYREPSMFSAVAVPTLALHGEGTWPMLRASTVAVADAVPQGRVGTLTGADHTLEPRPATEAIGSFLALG